MQCTWQNIGRCTAEPDYQLESCVDCGAAFHNTCTVNGVYALFEGQKELENAPDDRCGRCGDWQLGGAQAAAAERMHVDEKEEPLLCVIDELEVVTEEGRYRSHTNLYMPFGCVHVISSFSRPRPVSRSRLSTGEGGRAVARLCAGPLCCIKAG